MTASSNEMIVVDLHVDDVKYELRFGPQHNATATAKVFADYIYDAIYPNDTRSPEKRDETIIENNGNLTYAVLFNSIHTSLENTQQEWRKKNAGKTFFFDGQGDAPEVVQQAINDTEIPPTSHKFTESEMKQATGDKPIRLFDGRNAPLAADLPSPGIELFTVDLGPVLDSKYFVTTFNEQPPMHHQSSSSTVKSCNQILIDYFAQKVTPKKQTPDRSSRGGKNAPNSTTDGNQDNNPAATHHLSVNLPLLHVYAHQTPIDLLERWYTDRLYPFLLPQVPKEEIEKMEKVAPAPPKANLRLLSQLTGSEFAAAVGGGSGGGGAAAAAPGNATDESATASIAEASETTTGNAAGKATATATPLVPRVCRFDRNQEEVALALVLERYSYYMPEVRRIYYSKRGADTVMDYLYSATYVDATVALLLLLLLPIGLIYRNRFGLARKEKKLSKMGSKIGSIMGQGGDSENERIENLSSSDNGSGNASGNANNGSKKRSVSKKSGGGSKKGGKTK